MKHEMIQKIVLACLISMVSVGFAQVAPIDFETEGNGADWSWTPFENDSNPPVGIVANPDQTGINTSATVASFTALTTGQPWAGFESLHGAGIGPFSFDVTNSTVKVMVYKSVISDVGVKFAEASGEAQPEVKVANTVIDQWEELTFDLSGSIGAGITGIVDQIIIFPDFDLAGRTTDNTVYIDNVTFSGEELPPGPAAHAPVPTAPADDVISVFSDSYENIAGTNFYPGWGQATVASEVLIEGNNTLLYSGLNYQGIELGSAQDLTGMENLHVDFWSENATALQVFLISQSSGEQPYTFTVTNDAWVSVDIPLTTYSDLGLALTDIHQLKFVGDGDVYLDNLYFLGEVIVVEEGPNAPIDFEVDGYGAEWTWTAFENDSNPPLTIVANPSATGLNVSDSVASFTTLTTGQPWAGVESQHGADIGTFNLDASNSMVKIMVYKPVISDVGIKFSKPDGWSMGELKVANTVINEWEELTFDFSSQMQEGYDQIVVFPDFDLAGRAADNTCYFDNITFSEQELLPGPTAPAPVPTAAAADVSSIFSDTYTNIAGTNFYPGWGQATIVTEVLIEGNNTLLYSGLDYQGIELGAPQDVSGMESLHLDFWSANSTALEVFLISQTTGERTYALTVTNDSWVSVDIPLSAYTDQGLPTTDVFQLKIVGNGDVYLDNLYFEGEVIVITEPTVAAPTPVFDAADVVSLFSNAYTDVLVDTWSADWDVADVADLQIAGDDVKLYTGLSYAGIEAGSQPIDASAMNHFHMDIWTPDPTTDPAAFRVKLVDFGPDGAYDGGDDAEHELTFVAPLLMTGSWVGIDVPMSAFVGLTTQSNIAQIIISGDPNTIYMDNMYFYSAPIIPTEPESAAPTPTADAVNVISLFSNAYTDVTVDTWSADWDAADVADIQIVGDDVKLYTNLSFAGIEFTSQTVDATNMTHFHMDIWTPDPTVDPAVFKVKLVDFGADGAWSGGDDVEHELTFNAAATPALVTGSWISFDIPLADFAGMTTRGHLAQMIISGDPNTVYVDNIYFYSNTTGVEDKTNLTPSTFVLEQNFPNPFNPSTSIRFSLIESAHVVLSIYNINGQQVATVVNETMGLGSHVVSFDASGLATGSYFYSLSAGSNTAVKKMLLLK